ncbi:hypothetical protein D7X32_13815 [Corallococcus carmarthensis]|uniref:JAB domain-containing protein n=2 Tax=Corallococcus carmarthensis TaxID=2316728 RepID=A0A3A8KNE1_9BACT|nr:hypothetical protein D7X32_13815 [Corallococcus carmarthensis]
MKERDHEAGGILLGRRIVDSENVIVDQVGEPSSSDVQARFRFMRSKLPAQRLVDEAWASSNGTLNYLGEWHSHPEDHPIPSTVDLENWRQIALRVVFEHDFLVFIIIGRVSVRAWEVERQHVAIRQLVLISV